MRVPCRCWDEVEASSHGYCGRLLCFANNEHAGGANAYAPQFRGSLKTFRLCDNVVPRMRHTTAAALFISEGSQGVEIGANRSNRCSMMRVLFTTQPVASHWYQLVPLAQAL